LQPEKDRDTKAELNRRSQACDVLAGTGVRVAEMVEHQGIAPCIPVWKTGVCLSTPMPEKWNPVPELHRPLRFCKPPPELLGQRDEIKRRAETFASARVVPGVLEPFAIREQSPR
jgi:hypothetical protein